MKKGRKVLCGWKSFLQYCMAVLVCSTVTGEAGLIKTLDLVPSFFHCFDAFPTEKQQRVRWFSEEVIQSHPEIYRRPDVFKTDLTTLEKYLNQVTPYLPAIRKIHARFLKECEPIEKSFCARFPEFDRSRPEIYLMFSLFRFDGKIPHDNPRALFLALDGLAKFHGSNVPLDVILSHELFHLYHFQVNALPANIDHIPLYRQIWQEGLATYASASLNPKATMADVLLDPRLARDGPKYVPTAARALVTQLESTNDEATAQYLSYRRESKVPSRMGYLIGYDIVARLAPARSLQELARLRGQRLLSLMREQVRALAAQ